MRSKHRSNNREQTKIIVKAFLNWRNQMLCTYTLTNRKTYCAPCLYGPSQVLHLWMATQCRCPISGIRLAYVYCSVKKMYDILIDYFGSIYMYMYLSVRNVIIIHVQQVRMIKVMLFRLPLLKLMAVFMMCVYLLSAASTDVLASKIELVAAGTSASAGFSGDKIHLPMFFLSCI